MNADCVYSDNILKIISNSSGSVIPYDEFFGASESMKVRLRLPRKYNRYFEKIIKRII